MKEFFYSRKRIISQSEDIGAEGVLEEKLEVTVELLYAHAHGPAVRLFLPNNSTALVCNSFTRQEGMIFTLMN